MQRNTVQNFRARLRKRGYRNIKIKRCFVDGEELYLVKAMEPLGFYEVKVGLDLVSMYNWR